MNPIIKEYLSKRNAKAAKARWAGMTKTQRIAHINKMNAARLKGKKKK